MRRGVFVGSDETGHYRLETAEEAERRLTAENERLREALADMTLTWHRGIVHVSEPPFTLEACKYERCRTAHTLIDTKE